MFAFVRGWKTVDFAITVCTDELEPVVPRTFPPASAWSVNGHRIKAPLEYSLGPEKTWVYGVLRVSDDQELTRCAASRNSTSYIAPLEYVESDNPTGDSFSITDNLSSTNSVQTRAWMVEHLRLHHVFIPTGACWLNLQEGWWRLFRRDALPGRALPKLMRLSKPPASRPLSSIGELTPGSGVDHPRIIATTVASFLIAF